MNVLVYNKNLDQIAIIDIFNSLIWTKRYCDCGDFEMVIPLSDNEIPDYIQMGYYVKLSEDYEKGYLMIIETIEPEEDAENGGTLTISGRSLEAILDYRIVWNTMIFVSKSTWYIINKLLDTEIINPKILDRKISNFIVVLPDDDLKFTITDVEYNEDDNDTLLDITKNLCKKDDNGFSVRANLDTKEFLFKVYMGKDHSFSQTKNNIVIFSQNMDTMYSSKYLESIRNYKNVVQIIGKQNEIETNIQQLSSKGSTGEAPLPPDGDDENNGGSVIEIEEESVRVSVGNASGINRREYRETAGNISDSKFLEFIGYARLKEYDIKRLLEAEGVNVLYKYGVDYVEGDIVQLQNIYGKDTKARVTEMIFSQNTSGTDMYPTFETIS